MNETIGNLFDKAVTAHTNRPFIWYEGDVVTYGDAAQKVDRRMALLSTLNLEQGDRLGLVFPNDPEFVYLLLAATKLGVTIVPINFRQEAHVLSYLVEDAGLSALVLDRDTAGTYADIQSEVDVGTIIGHDVESTHESTIDMHLDDTLTNLPADTSSPTPAVSPGDVAVLNYTSGTTGPPKGVRNPHRSFVDSGHRLVDACGTGSDDRGLLILPLFHANPMTYGLMHMIAAGGSIGLVRSFSASSFWETARNAAASFFTHVGSILEILWRKADEVENTDTQLEFALGGAAGFERQTAFEDKFGIQVLRLYGLSEVGAGLVTVCVYDPDQTHHPAHQGPISDSPFEIGILAEDGLTLKPQGERGEIVVRPNRPALMFDGYLGKAEETVEDWQDLWMHTGDIGQVTETGNLEFVGRKKTSIRVYGENISPWEIESPLSAVNTLEETAAVGVPDDVAGEVILLYAVPTDTGMSPEDMHEICQEVLPDFLVPRYINSVESLPKTSTQKIERVALSERGAEGAWDSKQ